MTLRFFKENSRRKFIVVLLVVGMACFISFGAGKISETCGLNSRPESKAFLRMPSDADGSIPRLLSQTGVFKDTRNFIAKRWADSLRCHRPVLVRWRGQNRASISVPDGKIKFAAAGEWIFPRGTVFVKTFELATNESNPNSLRRLETRLLVCDSTGGVYGVTYKWRADNSDADLLATNLTEAITIKTATGVRTQMWYYPSRADCLTCHTANAGGVLGVKTRQLNRDFTYPSGVTDNELRAWNHIGLFDTNFYEADLKNFPNSRGSMTRRAASKTARVRISTRIARNAIARTARSPISTRVTTRRWRNKI